MKILVPNKCRKMFPETIFFVFEKTFFKVSVQNFCHYFTLYHWPTKFLIVFLQIIVPNYDLYWCYTFCTGVTLFALAFHLNCTALSQSESSNLFMCIIVKETRSNAIQE